MTGTIDLCMIFQKSMTIVKRKSILNWLKIHLQLWDVISTCGVTEFIQALTEDLKNSVFKNKITIHLSLHEIDEKRNELMPINNIYDYQEVIACCKKLYQVTNEKIGVDSVTEKSSVRHKRGIETCGQCNSGHYRRYNR